MMDVGLLARLQCDLSLDLRHSANSEQVSTWVQAVKEQLRFGKEVSRKTL